MLVYNTTYHVEDDVHDNFLIWLKESYIPAVEKEGTLKAPLLCRLLSHHHEGTSYALQWKVEDSAQLHRWHSLQGERFTKELVQMFNEKVVGFPTLMEVIE